MIRARKDGFSVREAEIVYRTRVVDGEVPTRAVTCDLLAVAILQPLIGSGTVERVWALLLDAKKKPLAVVQIGQGGEASSTVSVSELARAALLSGASAIVLAHNHPSGDPNPSDEDIAITKRIHAALRLLDVTLLDHIILTPDRHVSLKSTGWF